MNLKFTQGNCYGVIGANGAGKSTFLKLLRGDLTPTTGEIHIDKNERISSLSQDHYGFEEQTVMQTVIQGYQHLADVMEEKDALYAKPDFSDEDGIQAANLEAEFAEMDGWNAESDASQLLQSLDIPEELHQQLMSELTEGQKVKVLLARALFGEPDILLLDEPTNGLDVYSIEWLENFLADYLKITIIVSHDRHFLNQTCTMMCDVDFGEIRMYVGNYDFWLQSSQLAAKMKLIQMPKKKIRSRNSKRSWIVSVPMRPSPNRRLRGRNSWIRFRWMTLSHLHGNTHLSSSRRTGHLEMTCCAWIRFPNQLTASRFLIM